LATGRASGRKPFAPNCKIMRQRYGDENAEKWSIPFNWEEDPAIKAEWKERALLN